MDLRQLQYFKKTAELQHVTKAAQELMIAQPALTKSLKQLETELGTELFDRRGRNIYLNKTGEAFLIKVSEALAILEDAQNEVRLSAQKTENTLRLTFLASSLQLPYLIKNFKAIHPDVTFLTQQYEQKGTSEGESDFTVYSSLYEKAQPNSRLLITEEVCLAVPLDHPLAHYKSVHLKDVRWEHFISLKPTLGLRKTMDWYCNESGVVIKPVIESDDPVTVRNLVASGYGITFYPSVTWGRPDPRKMKLVNISDPVCFRQLYVSWPKYRKFSPLSQSFLNFITAYYQELDANYKSSLMSLQTTTTKE